MWIKIEDDIFYLSDISAQYSLMGKCAITIDVNILKHPEYYKYFIDKYESRKSFTLSNNTFIANFCVIKTIDIVFNERIILNISCDKIDSDISEIRDSIIDDILNDESQS